MSGIIIVTSNFPYGDGEEFLETEMSYYKFLDFRSVVVVPLLKKGVKRKIDRLVEVDDFVNQDFSINKIKYITKLVFLKFFYKELIALRFKTLNPRVFRVMMHSSILYVRYLDIFDKYFSQKSEIKGSIVYAYWHTESTYALQTLKEKYGYKLVSRIHRGDLYQESKAYGYMPLKAQFNQGLTKLFVITESAISYLVNMYGFDQSCIGLSRLGVYDSGIKVQPTGKKELSIVSCSHLVSVKRVDKIIHAVSELSKRNKSMKYKWTHIGSGELEGRLLQMAAKHLSESNVEFCFLGYLTNKEVYDFYEQNSVDVFLNVSESEGVPVSIMEAMSFSIPIVAPSVGGVSDMIENGESGVLLSSDSEIQEIVMALDDPYFFKDKTVRQKSYSLYADKYSAQKNYSSFTKMLAELKEVN